MSHICANDEYRSQAVATNRPENIINRYVSFVSLLSILFHWFSSDISKVTAHERI
jgi:hypothetical protein